MSADFVPLSYTLNLTEVNSTTLLVNYVDGFGNTINGAFSAAVNTGTDSWTITVLSQTIQWTTANQSAFWIEPEDSLEANEVSHSSDDYTHIFVSSDESLLGYVGTSQIVPDGTPVQFGTDGGTISFLIRFVDQAAQNENGTGVPDTGSSLSFLAMSVGGLVALNRVRKFKLA